MPFLLHKTRTFRARHRREEWKMNKCTCLLLMYGKVKNVRQVL